MLMEVMRTDEIFTGLTKLHALCHGGVVDVRQMGVAFLVNASIATIQTCIIALTKE